jgi:hypothetical protein
MQPHSATITSSPRKGKQYKITSSHRKSEHSKLFRAGTMISAVVSTMQQHIFAQQACRHNDQNGRQMSTRCHHQTPTMHEMRSQLQSSFHSMQSHSAIIASSPRKGEQYQLLTRSPRKDEHCLVQAQLPVRSPKRCSGTACRHNDQHGRVHSYTQSHWVHKGAEHVSTLHIAHPALTQ